MTTQIIESLDNQGMHITDGPLTVATTNEAVPGLLTNAIDNRITKVRPMSTPLDQITRCATARNCSSMIVEYYSVDIRPSSAKLTEHFNGGKGTAHGPGIYTHIMHTDNDMAFSPSETIYVPELDLVFYVVNRIEGGGIEVTYVPRKGGTDAPGLPADTEIVRMGRAAAELDVQTPQYQALPVKATNNCQIFKMQVEESTFMRIAGKEIGWSFSDQEESAIIDMRMGMERNFLFGVSTVIPDYLKGQDVYLTGGIWHQAGIEHELNIEKLGESDIIDLCKLAFTGNNGSKRKILLAGSEFMSAVNKIAYTKIVRAAETKVKWGIELNEFRCNFGSLYTIHSEIFDQCGHKNDAMVIDPMYITKYAHIPFTAEKIDLRKSGTRNTSAVVLTEASCVVLRQPKAHMRVVHKTRQS